MDQIEIYYFATGGATPASATAATTMPSNAARFRDVPGGHRQPSTGGEDPGHLGGRRVVVAEVGQQEVGDDRGERPVGKGEIVRVRAAEIQVRIEVRGQSHDRLGDVHADHRGASGRGTGGEAAGAGGYVQHGGVGSDVSGVQQRFDHLCGHGEKKRW